VPHIEKLVIFCLREQRGHRESLVRLADHQPLGGGAAQRLADRRVAHVKLAAQFVDAEA
jgi:hypothetical protein